MALLLTEEDVGRIVTMPMALEAVETSLKALGEEKASNHPRRRHRVDQGVLHVMDAAIPALGVMGLKSYTTARGGANRFHVLIYSAASGELEAVIAADRMGCFRTGAASGIATKHMARPEARVLGMIGAGHQAMTQLMAVCESRPIETARVYCRTRERLEAFCSRAADQVRAKVIPARSVEETLDGADVVVTITTSREPVLLGEALSEGTHVNAAGANSMLRTEIDRRAVTRAGVVAVDSKDQAQVESGSLVEAVNNSSAEWSNFVELGDIVAGKTRGRADEKQVTLFVSHGIGAWDVAIGKRVLDVARERGLGREIAL